MLPIYSKTRTETCRIYLTEGNLFCLINNTCVLKAIELLFEFHTFKFFYVRDQIMKIKYVSIIVLTELFSVYLNKMYWFTNRSLMRTLLFMIINCICYNITLLLIFSCILI